MSDPFRVCVYTGSSPGHRPVYEETARTLGRAIAERGWEVVYGGASVGTMGAVADAALEAGGRVHGVLPHVLIDYEVAHDELTNLDVVDNMHERKARMAELASAFVALPGGFGTLDEFFEILTWAQLEIHHKPVALLNVEGYYDPLLTFLDRTVTDGFLAPANRALLTPHTQIPALLEHLSS